MNYGKMSKIFNITIALAAVTLGGIARHMENWECSRAFAVFGSKRMKQGPGILPGPWMLRASRIVQLPFFRPIESSRFMTMPTVAAVAMEGSLAPKIGIMPLGKP